eukprot:TRINITY_DN102512_c0_g1_i1.p1 TRINITY_DN102512_c0_g1~~TRINITY_DN102512_c0_g1_i1.p1  ORF type:complete len:168 (+),score=20.55 TRINITY_DN102512_c0_g1_i1:79-582(+)
MRGAIPAGPSPLVVAAISACLLEPAAAYYECMRPQAPDEPPIWCNLCPSGYYSESKDQHYCMHCGVEEVAYITSEGRTACLNCKRTMTTLNADGIDLNETCGCPAGDYNSALVCADCPWGVSLAGKGQSGPEWNDCLPKGSSSRSGLSGFLLMSACLMTAVTAGTAR